MALKLIIAGIGGQGVVYATKVLSHAALARGERVMASENHGMSQRGGSVMAHLKIGGDEAPLIRRGTADALIGFDRVETMRNLTFIRPGGSVFVNTVNALEAAATERLVDALLPGDVVLVKASRGVALDALVDALVVALGERTAPDRGR